jgi:hypothetical protein
MTLRSFGFSVMNSVESGSSSGKNMRRGDVAMRLSGVNLDF